MTTSLAVCGDTGVSLIDLPRTEPLMIRGHPYRPPRGGTSARHRIAVLAQPGEDPLNPLTDVKTFESLLDDPVNEPTVTSV